VTQKKPNIANTGPFEEAR